MSRRRLDDSVDFIEGASLGSREATFNAYTPEIFKQHKRGREFDPLLHSTKPIARHQTPRRRSRATPRGKRYSNGGVLSFDEDRASDSMESFAHSASFIGADKEMQKKLAQFKSPKGAANLVTGDISSMPLKEQEKVFDNVQKENWRLKMTIVLLQSRLESGLPENQAQTINENIRLQAELQTVKTEVAMLRKRAEYSSSRESEPQSAQKSRGEQDSAAEALEYYKNKTEQLENQIEDLEYDNNRAEETKERLETEKQHLEDRIEELEQRLSNNNHDKSRSSIGDNDDNNNNNNNDENSSEKVSELQDEIEDLRFQLRMVTQEKEELEAAKEDRLHNSSRRESEQDENLAQLQAKFDEREKDVWRLEAEVATKDQELEESHQVSERQYERIQQLQQEKKRLEDQAFDTNTNSDEQVFELQQEKRALQRVSIRDSKDQEKKRANIIRNWMIVMRNSKPRNKTETKPVPS